MKNFTNTKILVCCHKECDFPKESFYFPIQVGKTISSLELNIQSDDKVNGLDCDNISLKNRSFCELTALYWAWKNLKTIYPNVEYIGLCHYRRYFKNIEKKLSKLLKSKRATLVSNFFIFPWSIETQYKISHISDDFEQLRNSVYELYPEYKNSFEKILSKGNKTLFYNMFVMSMSDFESYCKWLFDILFDVEKKIKLENYSPKQTRVFGYMAERLLLVYIENNNIKMIHDKVVNTENVNSRNFIKEVLNYIRYSISFYFNKIR